MTTTVRTARIAGIVLLAAAAGWLLWPAAVGGSTTYVVTHGTSMQPRFSTGDLAVLRATDSYGLGDVVAYSSPTLHTTVMHRIVAVDGNAFTTRGDHNSWSDPDHPTAAQIQGRLWLRVPQGGAAIQQLRQPWTLALLGAAGSALAWARKPRSARHRRGRRRAARTTHRLRPPALPTLPVIPSPVRNSARQAALGCAVVAVLAGAGEVVLLALPATQAGTSSTTVDQQARWDWSAPAAVSATYPSGRITTSDPIYTRLAGPITVSLRDTISAAGLTGLTGTVRLGLGVQTADGWRADVVTGAPATPVGGTTTASVVLDLAAATELVHRHVAEIGGNVGGATLVVTPRATLSGSVAGRAFTAAALPALTFTMDGIALRPGAAVPLSPSAPTTVASPVPVTRRLEAGSLSVPVDVAGTAVGVLAVLAVLAAGVCALAGRPGPDAGADDAPLRDSGRLLAVRRFTPGRSVVDVEDAAALLRIAERLDLLVLHAPGDGDVVGDVYAVQDGETTYLWTAGAGEPADEPLAERVPLRVVAPLA